MGQYQRALSAIARQNASTVFLRSLLAAELFAGVATREGRQYSPCCKLDESFFEAKKCLNHKPRGGDI
jgi:hypothetical protein